MFKRIILGKKVIITVISTETPINILLIFYEMEEVEVVRRTFDYLKESNYKLWVDNHPAYARLNSKDYPRHNITIKGFIPDLIGFNQFEDIIAIEAKGSTDIQKGIGQAITYKEGSELVYLAAESTSLTRFQNALQRVQIGSILVSEQNVEKNDPTDQFSSHYIADTRRELWLLSKDSNSTQRRLTSLSLNHIVNYLSPLLFVCSEMIEKKGVEKRLFDYNIKHVSELVRGAIIIGLLREQGSCIRISDEGFVVKNLLQLKGLDSLEKLEDIKKETSRRKGVSLVTEYPEIAITLRLLYNKNEFFMELLKIFEKQRKKELSFKEIVEDIVKNKPNLFINLLCKTSKKEEVLQLYQKGEEKCIYRDEEVLKSVVTHTSVFTFKKHLIHLGILTTENVLHSNKMSEYNPEEDVWRLK